MKRQYLSLIREYLSYFPCVVIVGARQTGKSTLISMLKDGRELFDLESRADYDHIASDPDLFLRLNSNPIAIDEAQILPELFPALRVAIDNDRNNFGKYLLTGSSSPELLSAISESLAGRVAVIEIAPLSLSETLGIDTPNLLKLFSGSCSVDEIVSLSDNSDGTTFIDEYWLNGGYPEPWLRDVGRFREIWREEYIKSYIERDIARLYPNLNAVRFRRFIELLAGCSGTIINYSNIAKVLDVSQPTIKDYFKIAHGTFIWRNIPAYSKNVTKRVIKHPRGYFRDSGLLHHLLQLPSNKRLLSHPQMGASWEGMIVEELLRILTSAGIQHKPYYYRTSGGAEVDLILEGQFGLIPFEIKHTQNVKKAHLRSIKDFVQEFNCAFGIIINRDEKIRLYESNIVGLPLHMLL